MHSHSKKKVSLFGDPNAWIFSHGKPTERYRPSIEDDFGVDYYICQSQCMHTGRKHRGRKYCSFCSKIHGNLTTEEGVEKLYRNKKESRRTKTRKLFQQDNSSGKNLKEKKETSSTCSSSSSSSLISVTGEKLYKMPKQIAKEKIYRQKGITNKQEASDKDYHSANGCNTYRRTFESRDNHLDNDCHRVVIKVVIPTMG
jgi:hypothetical protein